MGKTHKDNSFITNTTITTHINIHIDIYVYIYRYYKYTDTQIKEAIHILYYILLRETVCMWVCGYDILCADLYRINIENIFVYQVSMT